MIPLFQIEDACSNPEFCYRIYWKLRICLHSHPQFLLSMSSLSINYFELIIGLFKVVPGTTENGHEMATHNYTQKRHGCSVEDTEIHNK